MRFIAFDLETTGIFAGVDQIVEIGAVRFIENKPEAIFATLVDPKMPIPISASRINGISDKMVKGKPIIESLLDSFAKFCGDDVLVAHNAPFDVQFLTNDIKKFESTAPRGLILDTCSISRKVFPGLANYKLGTLIQHLKIKATKFHRAEEDASYCGHLFMKILEKVSPMGDHPPLENLVALSGKNPVRFPQIEKQPKQLELL